MLFAALALALAQQAGPPPASSAQPTAEHAARNPAYAADGRLALSVRGNLWIVNADGRWAQLTSDSAWDREPAWVATPGGGSLVFSSNRGGAFQLWEIAVTGDKAAGPPVRITSSDETEGQPAVAADGRILFVRGRGSAARIWVRTADGSESRLTSGPARGAEQWPAVSPDAKRVAYVLTTETGSSLRTRALDDAKDETTVVSDRPVEHPAWSAAGDRLTFTAGGSRPGVFVTPLDGRYVNLVSARHAESSWSPDGRHIVLVDLPEGDVAYNGDPNRLGDREAGNSLADAGRLWVVDAPAPPEDGVEQRSAPALGSRAERAALNARAFDEVWSRTAKLYYAAADAGDRRARWEALRSKYRPRALAAAGDDELRSVIHDMLREHPPYRAPAVGRAAVASAHPVATAAGLEMLRMGGNVVDAAAAVSFALGVVEPDASGVGGYGQMLVFRKGMAGPKLIEFMTRVPEDASLANGDLLRNGRLPPDGPVLANVPGTVAAMHLAWRRYGSGHVTWADIVAPAIRAARDGYVVSEGLATTLATERDRFLKYDGSRKLFFRDGKPLAAGDTIRNPDLAWTLEQIAKGGADGFYKGEVARRIVGDLRARGNAMKLSDLARYYAADRDPVSSTYRGYTLFSSAPPVSGGATLAAMLNLLEQYPDPKAYPDDPRTLHAMISAWQLVPSSRNRIADPGLWPVDVAPFVDKDTARARWRCFDPDRAVASELFHGDTLVCPADAKRAAEGDGRGRGRGDQGSETRIELTQAPACEAHGYGAEAASACLAAGTTAFVVADGEGNVVTATQTLGTWGGNFYVSPGLGFLYNDKLASYGTDPTAYGARLPFARHGSTISPTIVFAGSGRDAHPVYALGAAGNAWITSAVYETLVGMVDQHLDPQAALELPRFLVGGRAGAAGARDRATTVEIEDGFSPEVMKRLSSLGYRIQTVSLMGELREGYGSALAINNGKVTAGADPRRAGAAGAIP